ncbi:hypothetical protein [Leeuwenhoekiella blandensis]|uniref:hypothetical protein n=1 Tax=Leeuwenhoekiella blandensis TaxID=360293 RepID=UPI0023524C21|nr:hypothetical protein [Leeuwenhoekiella blandensis]
MKRILLLLFMTALSLSQTHAKDTNTATDWTGTYNTNFGQIILHQKANYVVGTYRDLGGIRSMYVSNNQLIGVFYNNGKEGHFKFTKTAKGFTGKWGWTYKLEGGSWDGNLVADVKQHYLKGQWNTDYEDLFLIHSPTGIVAGHYGDKGGMIWGKYAGTKIFTGNYTNALGREPRTCSFIFTDNNTFKGKFDANEYGSWNGTRVRENTTTSSTTDRSTAPQPKFKLKITLNSFKCNGADNLFNREQGFVYVVPSLQTMGVDVKPGNFNIQTGDQKVSEHRSSLYPPAARFKENYPVGTAIQINNSAVYPIIYPINLFQPGRYAAKMQFVFREFPVISKGGALVFAENERINAKRNIELKEVLKFLSGQTRAEDYPLVNGTNGRRRLPNSNDTFWLESIGGKRYVRGYGDIIEPKKGKIRFGYHYTMELLPL